MAITGARLKTRWTRSRRPYGPRLSGQGSGSRSGLRRVATGGEMDRAELQAQIDELMRQYDVGEIDGETYAQKMMELTASAQD